MDQLTKIAAQLFPNLLSAVVVRAVDKTLAKYPDLNIGPSREVDAFIQGACGNSGPGQLMAIERYVGNVLRQHQEIARLQQLTAALERDFDAIEHKLRDAEAKYEAFLHDKCHATWARFTASTGFEDAVSTLFEKLVKDSASKEKVLSDFAAWSQHDVEKYQTWQGEIALVFVRAYQLRTAYHYYATFSDKSYDEHAKLKADQWTTDLPAHVITEMGRMEATAKRVVELLDENLKTAKTYFLVKTCGDPLHQQNCGAGNDEQCCELQTRVYQMLKKHKNSANRELAPIIAKDLRKTYPHFRWSVVVFEGDDPRDAESVVNDKHSRATWLQRSGSVPSGSLKRPLRKRVVHSKGLGEYGCFVCYRIRKLTRKTAVIFWVEPAVVEQSGPATQAYDRLTETWAARRKAQQHKDSDGDFSVENVTRWVREEGEDFVFGVGVHLEVGKAAIGMCLEETDKRTYPLCLANENGQDCTLVWPESRATSDATLGCTLDKGFKECLPVAALTRSRLFKGKLAGNGQFVAIKEITISPNEEERKTQVESLAAVLRPLKKFDHPHIVKHIGFQVAEPQGPRDFMPSYQIIMELLSGGSLTQRASDRPVSMAEICYWCKGILEGLTYLYLHNIRHNKIQGDHLHFAGPGLGEGPLKIIALGRADQVLWSTTRTYGAADEAAQRYAPFQAPTSDTKTGSKTDMWSFGCLIIQMVSGSPPASVPTTHKGWAIRVPVVPDYTPKVLRGVIERCLSLDYDSRPSAATILGVRVFDEMPRSEMDWVSPPRVV